MLCYAFVCIYSVFPLSAIDTTKPNVLFVQYKKYNFNSSKNNVIYAFCIVNVCRMYVCNYQSVRHTYIHAYIPTYIYVYIHTYIVHWHQKHQCESYIFHAKSKLSLLFCKNRHAEKILSTTTITFSLSPFLTCSILRYC